MPAMDHGETVTLHVTEEILYHVCMDSTFGIAMRQFLDFHFMIVYFDIVHLQFALNWELEIFELWGELLRMCSYKYA